MKRLVGHVQSARSDIEVARKRIAFLWKHRRALRSIETCDRGIIFYASNRLDFDDLPHKEVIKVVREFGGKWKKTAVQTEQGPRVNYDAEIDGMKIRCCRGQAPPACRIVEVEELVPEQIVPARVIPASVRKVRKMICPGDGDGADSLTMAVARQEGVVAQ